MLRAIIVGQIVRSYWVYILAGKLRGTLYIGVSNGIIFASSNARSPVIKGAR
jgi:hypothetical protein